MSSQNIKHPAPALPVAHTGEDGLDHEERVASELTSAFLWIRP
jgi:hypothetical protein